MSTISPLISAYTRIERGLTSNLINLCSIETTENMEDLGFAGTFTKCIATEKNVAGAEVFAEVEKIMTKPRRTH